MGNPRAKVVEEFAFSEPLKAFWMAQQHQNTKRLKKRE